MQRYRQIQRKPLCSSKPEKVKGQVFTKGGTLQKAFVTMSSDSPSTYEKLKFKLPQ
jgi:hypothetical protein